MNELPLKARIYLWAIFVATTAVTVSAACDPCPITSAQMWAMPIFIVLAVLAGSKKIALSRVDKSSGSMSMSLGFTVTYAAMLFCGPLAGMLTGVVGCVSSGIKGRSQTPVQILFNSSLAAIEIYVAGIIFLALHGNRLAVDPIGSIPALIASVLVYFLVNTVGVSLIIAFATNQNPFQFWRQTFSWTAPSYFAGASISTLAVYICGTHILYFAIFLSPVLYLTYQSYSTYRARMEEQQKHVEELQARQVQLADLYLATIKSLALAIDAKDQYTHQHILRVQRYAVAIAIEMGLTGDELEGINTGALLHDIGKLGVPEYVLLKPGRLTDEEFAKIKKHPEIGAAILEPVEFPWPVLPVVKYHHEKWDGTGYPEGLKGENIPLSARILAVADVYDALTSSRSYRAAWDHERAMACIKKDAGTHFDVNVVDAFVKVIDRVLAEVAAEQKDSTPAGLVPAALDSARSYSASGSIPNSAVREIQQASADLWALYEVAQSLSCSLGLSETLDILCRKVEGIVLPGAACVFLLFEDTEMHGDMFARSATGANVEFFRGSRTLKQDGVSLTAARERRSYIGAYDSDDLMITSSPVIWQPLQSALIVPILHENSVLGTINLYHPQPNAFSEHDQHLLETIGERAAMAIYNGLMFDRTRSHAMTDPLTELYNFRYLTQSVDAMCKEGQLFSLVCLDLDDFKPINDNFGHQKGDEVLRDLALILRSAVGDRDIVSRYGGDEFLIVLAGKSQTEAQGVAEQIQAIVTDYDPRLIHPTIGPLRIGASIGVSCYPADSDAGDCTALLAAADSAMYRNKTERKLRRLAGAATETLRQLPKAA